MGGGGSGGGSVGGAFPNGGVLNTDPQALYAAHGFTKGKPWTGKNPATNYLKERFIPGMGNVVGQGIDQANALMPMRENVMQQALALLSSGNQTSIDRQRRSENETAMEKARQLAVMMGDQGAGSGNVQGAQAGAFSDAAQNTNNYAAQLNSPEYRQQLMQQIMQMIQQGIQIPGLEQFLGMSGDVQGRHQPQQGGGLMGAMAPFLGQALGGPVGAGIGKILGL